MPDIFVVYSFHIFLRNGSNSAPNSVRNLLHLQLEVISISVYFSCLPGMPAELVNLCDWMNGNKRDHSGDVVMSNPTHASNGEVIDLG